MAAPVPEPRPADSAGPASVLLAEHEPEVAEMSARYLLRNGLRVHLVSTPETALAELTSGLHAMAVLDLTMPGLDPRRIRRALRTPVILLVAGPRPRGLGPAAARRWLGRPFSPRQLVVMTREMLTQNAPPRRAQASPAATGPAATGPAAPGPATTGPTTTGPAPAAAGRLRLDGGRRSAIADGQPVSLTPTEFALLAAMMDRQGRVLSRRQLLAAAGRPAASDRAADVYIAQLRAKIGPAGAIRTVRGTGYVLDPLQGGQ